MPEEAVNHAVNVIEKQIPLTRGLLRNTIFNVFGWLWPVALSFFSIPYILKGLGTEAYGIFGIVSLTAGYLGLLSSPMAFGNIRFMAEAYGRQDWKEFFQYVFAGLWVSAVIAGSGALVMWLLAVPLANNIFKIPAAFVPKAICSFQLAAISFFFNGLAAILRGIPLSIRRFDLPNVASAIVGTFNTVGIVLAIYMGWGLTGAVWAQLLSSIVASVAFGGISWWLLRDRPLSELALIPDLVVIKKLIGYSLFLFGGSVFSSIGIQLDRVLVGILMGASSVTYYTIPTKITDNISGLTERLAMSLYPLSAEGLANGRVEEVQQLYLNILRWIFLITAYIAALLIITSRDILLLWVGADVASKSALVMAFLAMSHIPRSAGGVFSNALNGLGRADVNVFISLWTLICCTVPVILLAPQYGLLGMAFGMMIGMVVANSIPDVIVQRKFLKQLDWKVTVVPYVRAFCVVGMTVGISTLFSFDTTNWLVLIAKIIVNSFIFFAFANILGMVRKHEYTLIKSKLARLKRLN